MAITNLRYYFSDKYNWCVDRVISSMKLLLQLVPCMTASSGSVNTETEVAAPPEAEEATFISLMRKENQKREKFVALRESEGPASSLNMWKSLFNTWQALQHSAVAQKKGAGQRKKSPESLLTTLPAFISSFIQKGGDDLTQLSSLIDRRVERAR